MFVLQITHIFSLYIMNELKIYRLKFCVASSFRPNSGILSKIRALWLIAHPLEFTVH